MSENPESSQTSKPETVHTPSPGDLAIQVAQILRDSLHPPSSPPVSLPENLNIAVKLTGSNFALWSRVIYRAILGRGRSSHLTGLPPPPPKTDPQFPRWEHDDNSVFTWILQNVDPSMINNVSRYPTAKALWDGLALTSTAQAAIHCKYLTCTGELIMSDKEIVHLKYAGTHFKICGFRLTHWI